MELTREIVAYSMIGIITLTAIVTGVVVQRRRKRIALRRRGIKTYSH